MTIPAPLRKRTSQNLALTAVVTVLVVALWLAGAFDGISWKLFDTFITSARRTPEHKSNVVIVCIDQSSIDFYARNGTGWPWPRDFYGGLLSYLAADGAKAVFFDIIMSEPDIDRFAAGSTSDESFADAIRETGIAYLAASGLDEDVAPGMRDPLDWRRDLGLPLGRITTPVSYRSALPPLRSFRESAGGVGIVNILPENDGIHRRYALVSGIGGQTVPTIGTLLARAFLGPEAFERRMRALTGDPGTVDPEGRFIMDWYGPGGVPGPDASDSVYTFTYLPIAAVMMSAIGESSLVPTGTFKDKVVIVGSNAPGLLDMKPTPFTHMNPYPGMEVHATAVENLIAGDVCRRMAPAMVVVLLILSALALFGVDTAYASIRHTILGFVVLLAIQTAATVVAFASLRIIPESSIPIATFGVFLAVVLNGYFHESQEKRLIRRSFGRYVNESVLHDILANPAAVNFDGRTITATIMATDIADFTTISEALPPNVVVARLNDYLSDVSESLIDNGAFINKYIGDAILALFGAFNEPDHQHKALTAALMARAIISRKIDTARTAGDAPLITRFGITTGEMTMGNIGSTRKIEYTVIGDTVNSAFRLEGLNKFYGTTILASNETREAGGDDFIFRRLDLIRYKGKENAVQIYELIGAAGDVSAEVLEIRDTFEAAMDTYRDRRFEEAHAVFKQLADNGDTPSAVFAGRCEKFITDPPPPDWDAVWKMLRK